MHQITPDDQRPPCPRCGSTVVLLNGTGRCGTQNHLCRDCGRQFVLDPRRGPVGDEKRQLVERMLLERLGIRAIARVTRLSRSWVQRFANELFRERTPWHPDISAPGPLADAPGDAAPPSPAPPTPRKKRGG